MPKYQILIAASGKHGSALLPYVLVDDKSGKSAAARYIVWVSTKRRKLPAPFRMICIFTLRLAAPTRCRTTRGRWFWLAA